MAAVQRHPCYLGADTSEKNAQAGGMVRGATGSLEQAVSTLKHCPTFLFLRIYFSRKGPRFKEQGELWIDKGSCGPWFLLIEFLQDTDPV